MIGVYKNPATGETVYLHVRCSTEYEKDQKVSLVVPIMDEVAMLGNLTGRDLTKGRVCAQCRKMDR